MTTPIPHERKWTERSNAPARVWGHDAVMFEHFFERSADAIWILDPARRVFVDCNDAAVELMHARGKAELLLKRPDELSPPRQPDGSESAQRVDILLEEVRRNGSVIFEWVVRRLDGVEIPLRVLATVVQANGRELHVIVARDISQRKLAEAAVRESERLLVSIADNVSEALYRTGPQHELIFANRAYLRLSGYESLAEMQSVPRETLYACAADRERLLRKLIQDGAFQNEEIEYIRRDGRHWWGLTNSVAIRDPETGAIQYHVGSVADITERKHAEAAWRESEARFRRMFEKSTDAISLLDVKTGVFVDVNEATARMLGHRNAQALINTTPAQDSPELQPDGRRSDEKAADGIARALREGSTRFEWLGKRADGTVIPMQIALTSVGLPEQPQLLVVTRDITERKRAEEEVRQLTATLERRIEERTAELRDSEARLRTLVEHAPEAIVVFDGDTGRFLSCNAPALELYGYEQSELTRLTPAEVSPEFQPEGGRSAELARVKMDEALAGGTPVFEWMHKHKSGRLIETEVRLVRLPAEGRRLLRASIADDTERRRRERIQHSTYEISEAVHTTDDLPSLYARIHAIVKTLMPAENFYIALADPNGRTFSFPYLVDAHDLSTAPLPLDQGWTGYVLRSGKSLLAGRHKAVTSDGATVVADDGERVAAADCGAPVATIWLGAPLTIRGRTFGVVVVQDYENPRAYAEEEKRILTFVGGQIAQAIERKRAEQALRESEEKFRTLFEASSQGVMLHDERQYLEVNPAAVRILGYRSQAELVGRHPRDTSPPVQANGERTDELAQKYITECLAKGSVRFEWLAQRATGESIPLEVVLTRIEWSGRQIIQAGITDISERKRAEEELLRSLAREKELGQLKNNFVAMVSHEFRTPLGIIQSSTEILADYLDQLDPAARREQLESIVKNTRRMANLMEEVLVLGRLDAGRMAFNPSPLDLRVFCQRIVDEISAVTERRCPLVFSCECDESEVQADESLLRHIFGNLLSNAVKFSDPSKPVEFSVLRAADDLIFTVRDRGAGIPAADLPWLFNAFHRGRNVGHVPGTGLGLTIVKRCVELHRGQIKIQSEVGQGTTVTVGLPALANSQPL